MPPSSRLDLETPFDRLAAVACAMFDTPHAFIGVLEGERAVPRASIGLGYHQMPANLTAIGRVAGMGPGAVLVIEDTLTDEWARNHPMVTGNPHLRFFAGVSIVNAAGESVGAIGITDTRVRSRPSDAEIDNLKLLARIAGETLDRAEAAQQLKEQLELLRLTEEMAGVGHWRIDAETLETTWSDRVYAIHGVTRETFDPGLDDTVAFVHPEDRVRIQKDIRHSVEPGAVDPTLLTAIGSYNPEDTEAIHTFMARAMKKGEGYEARLRLKRADGEERVTRSIARCERDETGAVTAVLGVFQDITEEVNAHEQQAEMVETLKLAEEIAGVGHWRWEVETNVVTWSDVVYAIHGRDLTFEPTLDVVLAGYHPEDQASLRALIEHAMATGEGYECQLRLLRPDGAERITQAKALCEVGPEGRVQALFGVIQDVTETVRAHEAVAASERSYRLLASRVTDIIVTYGVDGLMTYVSPSVEAATGYPPEALIGRPATSFIHPDDVSAVTERLQEFIKAPPEYSQQSVTYRLTRADGEVRWFEARTSIIRDDEDGRAVEFQDVVRDVTDTKRLEEALIEARDRAEAGAKAKSEFLANMSHELRTPLTSVVGFSGLLEGSANLPATELIWANRIATASSALLGVINDILDYSKLEADAVELDPQPFDPRAMAEGAAAILESQCLARGLTLTVDVAAGLPAALVGDEGRLRQVTLNFLSNAVKFTPTGEIRLTVTEDAGQLRVVVSDSGIGIAPDKIAQLFDRFTQADASTTRVYGGTGLGLAISRRLIEMMGGQIGADSRPGEGSTFWFTVPLLCAEAARAQAAPADSAMPVGLRVLMADDAPANRELVTAIMGGLGVDLDTVCDGAEAVEAARSGAYDLILMDVHMPVMDGLAATRAIRAMGGAAALTPIVALTANVQPEQVEHCMAAGMDAHVGKPIQLAELLAVMNRASQFASDRAEPGAGRVAE